MKIILLSNLNLVSELAPLYRGAHRRWREVGLHNRLRLAPTRVNHNTIVYQYQPRTQRHCIVCTGALYPCSRKVSTYESRLRSPLAGGRVAGGRRAGAPPPQGPGIHSKVVVDRIYIIPFFSQDTFFSKTLVFLRVKHAPPSTRNGGIYPVDPTPRPRGGAAAQPGSGRGAARERPPPR